MRAVADSGPLIHLSRIDQLPLLNLLFESITVPPAVKDEVLLASPGTLGLDGLALAFGLGNIMVSPLADERAPEQLPASLGAGEVEAMRLTAILRADVLLIDDAPARREAQRRGLDVLGTVGILTRARETGLLGAVYPLVLQLRERGQWLSDSIVQSVRDQEEGSSQA